LKGLGLDTLGYPIRTFTSLRFDGNATLPMTTSLLSTVFVPPKTKHYRLNTLPHALRKPQSLTMHILLPV